MGMLVTLSFANVILSLISTTGNWWRGNFGADTFLGFGTADVDVSLWQIKTDGSLLGFSLPQNEFSIDSEHMCGKEQGLAKLQDVCSKIHIVRGFVVTSVLFVLEKMWLLVGMALL